MSEERTYTADDDALVPEWYRKIITDNGIWTLVDGYLAQRYEADREQRRKLVAEGFSFLRTDDL